MKYEWAGSKVQVMFQALACIMFLSIALGNKPHGQLQSQGLREYILHFLLKKLQSYMAKGMSIRGDNELELMIQLIPEDVFSRLQLSIQGTHTQVLFE